MPKGQTTHIAPVMMPTNWPFLYGQNVDSAESTIRRYFPQNANAQPIFTRMPEGEVATREAIGSPPTVIIHVGKGNKVGNPPPYILGTDPPPFVVLAPPPPRRVG
ncbi:hypothetical protein ACP70R_029025 [Stipagrostis hirtigluma subsp. patula]